MRYQSIFRLRDVQTGKLLKTLVGHTNNVSSVVYSPDGGTLASGSWDGKICFWDVATGQLQKTITGHEEGIPSIAYLPDGESLVSGGWDNNIHVWYVPFEHLLQTIAGNITEPDPGNGVRSMSLNPDGRTLAVATDEDVIRLWDILTGKVKVTLASNRHGAAVAFSSVGNVIAAEGNVPAGQRSGIRLWDVETGKPLKTLKPVRGVVYGIAFSPDGQTLASASWQTIEVWNTITGERKGVFTAHPGWNRVVAFTPDGQILASGSDNGTVILWDMNQIPD